MSAQIFERVAANLRRPADTLSALSGLASEELEALDRTIEEACKRQRDEVTTALRRALPQPLRSLILGKLAGRT
ncbi:MAG TPA: hypothetical protein VN046_05545 [Stenotrophobium sp.]|jgi:hypothetical protein|nr:hypothetical protein [Stenotrophobium sp.]